ncbi:MAG TPA: DUF4258 domain-containing protein [Chitinophagaceae bacterium]|jgi:hypothetical protein|nr:DUF4258 domain-containing protein [Chitinophagaceae bacterium]
MKSRNVTVTLIIILVILAYAGLRWYVLEPHKKEIFNRHPGHLVYTHHALCRMDCRHITKEDIDEIMRSGIIFLNKSNLYDKPCPTFALQGFTNHNEDLRIIFAQCDSETKVVTCYNLHKEFECHCPGDDEDPQQKNRN